MLLVRLFLLGVTETVRFGARLGRRALRRIIFHNFRIPDVDDADGVRNGRRDTDRRRLRRCSRAGRTAPVRNPLVATGRGRHGLALAVTERVRMRHCVIEKKNNFKRGTSNSWRWGRTTTTAGWTWSDEGAAGHPFPMCSTRAL